MYNNKTGWSVQLFVFSQKLDKNDLDYFFIGDDKCKVTSAKCLFCGIQD